MINKKSAVESSNHSMGMKEVTAFEKRPMKFGTSFAGNTKGETVMGTTNIVTKRLIRILVNRKGVIMGSW